MTQKQPPQQPEPILRENKPDTLTFQWSIFIDAAKREQFVLQSHNLADLLNNRELLFALITQEAQQLPAQEPAPAQESDPAFCSLHMVQMKQRTNKDGNTWFDHRWQDENNKWHICNGKSETVQQPRS